MSFKGLTSGGSERRSDRGSSTRAHHNHDQQHSFKLVMVGDSGVGKSCLLEKLLHQESTNNFISTIGIDVKTHYANLNGQTTKLQVWDTGGQQRYRHVLSACYQRAHGVIVVFDVTNAKSFSNLPQWVREINEFTSDSMIPRLLVGNKSDLSSSRREVPKEKAEKFVEENEGFVAYVETSAIKTINVHEAFFRLVLQPSDVASETPSNRSMMGLKGSVSCEK